MLRCITLTAEKDSDKLTKIRENLQWIDAVEIRLDLCSLPDSRFITSVLETAPSTVILTYRRIEDGGMKKVSEEQRLDLIETLLQPGISYVDLEYRLNAPRIEKKARKLGIKIIRSLHDFDGIPSKMSDLIQKIAAEGEIPKIACFPRSSREVQEMLNAVERTAHIQEKIVLGMGEFGFFTRVAPRLCGSMLTFCSGGTREGAPGQISARQLEEVYHVSAQDADTVYYGIIGNPVLHSESPRIHNKWFAEKGMNAVYLPFQVDDVGLFMEAAIKLRVRGFSVTVPHKQQIIDCLDQVEPAVRSIGSCNTVIQTEAGWFGSNTDYEGFLKPLKKGDMLKPGAKALVVGAGGVARTVVYALRWAGLVVTIVNRTDEKAKELARETGACFHPVQEDLEQECFYLVVQTSSAGMAPHTDVDPLPGYNFCGSELVYELIYAPEKTLFAERAAAAGCRVIGGREMLHGQAVLQFELFSSVYNLGAG